ncbi:MAG: type II toxin-antitoxin system HicA family toxin [Candidatus Binataceae bacterium]
MSSRLLPCSRREFVRRMRALGYDGPYAGSRHQYMVKSGRGPVVVPNPHGGAEISTDLLSRVLRQANITRDEWLST